MPISANPLDEFTAQERALFAILFGPSSAQGGMIAGLRRIRRGDVEQAIRLRSIVPVVSAPNWSSVLRTLESELESWNYQTLALAFNQATNEIPPAAQRAMFARIGELAEENAGRRAVAAAKKLDAETRKGLRELIGAAAREYASDPSPAILKRLTTKISKQIGITAKQARYIQRWERAARRRGMKERDIASVVGRRTQSALIFRSRATAARGLAEAVGWGRHQLWLEAMDAGLLPQNIKKRWRDQRDGRERASHRRQTEQGPIPLEAVYPIQGVLHPPSRDEGCRCFEELVYPGP